jgi:hypothetical protein
MTNSNSVCSHLIRVTILFDSIVLLCTIQTDVCCDGTKTYSMPKKQDVHTKINTVILPWEGAQLMCICIIYANSVLQGIKSAPRYKVYGIKTIDLQLPGRCLIKRCATLSMRSRLTVFPQGFHLFTFWESDCWWGAEFYKLFSMETPIYLLLFPVK